MEDVRRRVTWCAHTEYLNDDGSNYDGRTKGVEVEEIQICNSENKGLHFYIDIASPVRAELANELQFLLGDDCGRVDRNRARIRSGLKGWNKLFERPNAILMTIFRGELHDGPEREFSGRNG